MTDQRKRKWTISCPVCGKESYTEQEFSEDDLRLLDITWLEGDKIETECNKCRLHYAEITGGDEDCEFV